MFSLIYISKCITPLPLVEIDDIRRSSLRNNSTNDITGLLIYNGDFFMQLLEGAEEKVEFLLDKIASDDRHKDLLTVRRKRVEQRECPNWSLRVLDISDTSLPQNDLLLGYFPHQLTMDTQDLFTSFASVKIRTKRLIRKAEEVTV